MIKATFDRPGKGKLVLLGLSEENLRRLREDMPILVLGAELGVDHDIAIVAGLTEDTILAQLRSAGWVP